MRSIKIKQISSYAVSDLHNLQSTYGVSFVKLTKLSLSAGLNTRHSKFISKRVVYLKVQKIINLVPNSVELRSRIKKALTFLWSIRSYKGFRHKFCLPARGQRTKTNARTKKKFKLSRSKINDIV